MESGSIELALGDIQELVSQLAAGRDALRWRGRATSHAELTDRSRRLANALLTAGLGAVTPRSSLEPWEAGQDFVGIFMPNRPEFLETLFGCLKARCVPYNINYRYTAAEVVEVVSSVPGRAIVYDVSLAPTVAELGDTLAGTLLIEVGGGDAPAVRGARAFNDVLAAASPERPPTSASPDDLYVVFTGGTTGRPKAVMWRQADAYVSALGGTVLTGDDPYGAIRDRVGPAGRVTLAAPPFMHGGGQWAALSTLLQGGAVAIQDNPVRLDCDDIWSTIARDRVTLMLITGNAYAVPLLDQLHRAHYDLSSLRFIITGAVAMTADVKRELLAVLPEVTVVETIGATESGTHLTNTASSQRGLPRGFRPSDDTVVLDDARGVVLGPGHDGTGWLARVGNVPLGYLGDEQRTRVTFPSIGGRRCAVAGDRARLLANGEIHFLGRDNVTINSGGEKIFAEEVEAALSSAPDVFDVLVAGAPHPRWGEEVVALVSLRPGASATAEDLRAHVAARLARFKVPKRIEFVDAIPRNAVGKPDYGWARERVAAGPVPRD